MRFIHQMPGWPKVTWQEKPLLPLLAAVRHRQGKLLGKVEGLGFRTRVEANMSNLTSATVKSSAIEGEFLDVQEVRSSIARQLGLEFAGMSPSSRKVDGVVEMMLDATQNYEKPLTEARLFHWHHSLFPNPGSMVRQITVGAWRPSSVGAMQVVSGPIGKEKVHFEAPAARRLARETKSFLHWFNSESSVDPVLKAGLAHFWFVTIHPFEDGNGRISRAIADLSLARADGTNQRFYSMSSQIEAERKEYYLQLEKAQKGSLDISRWMTWFLECLDRSIQSAALDLEMVLRRASLWDEINAKGALNDRQRKVMQKFLGNFQGHLTSSKYAKIAKCSQDTAGRDIKDLLDRKMLVSQPGGGRNTAYALPAKNSDFA